MGGLGGGKKPAWPGIRLGAGRKTTSLGDAEQKGDS